MRCSRSTLRGPKRVVAARDNASTRPPSVVAQFEHVAGEALVSSRIDGDDFPARPARLAEHALPGRGAIAVARRRRRSACRSRASRSCDRSATPAAIGRVECAGLDSRFLHKLVERCGVRARRQAGVRDACSVIEDDAARALEVTTRRLVVRQVEQPCSMPACATSMAPASSWRRSSRRFGASIGYSTTVPSACRLTQLFGKTASGHAGCARSSTTMHVDAGAPQCVHERVELEERRGDAELRPPAIVDAGSDCSDCVSDSSRTLRAAPSARRSAVCARG